MRCLRLYCRSQQWLLTAMMENRTSNAKQMEISTKKAVVWLSYCRQRDEVSVFFKEDKKFVLLEQQHSKRPHSARLIPLTAQKLIASTTAAM